MGAYSCGAAGVSDSFGLAFGGTSFIGVQACGIGTDIIQVLSAPTGSHSGNDTCTVTPTQFPTIGIMVFCAEYAGTVQDSPFQIGSGTSVGPSTVSTANGTTTGTGDILIGFGESAVSLFSAGTGYTIEASETICRGGCGAPPIHVYFEDASSGTPGSYNASFAQAAASDWGVGFLSILSSPSAHRRIQVIRHKSKKVKREEILTAAR
jgi:hypothetical protein